MRPNPVTIVNISSPSYTGTTWLCLLLGSHARALTVGPPDRVWGLRGSGFAGACRVHGEGCAFWDGFAAAYDPAGNFYLQLADYSGRDYIVINNPSPEHEAAEMRHPDLIVKTIRIVRDGRALACSFARHLKIDVHDAIRDQVRPLFREFPFEPDRDDLPCARYEDVLADQWGWLARFGRFIGLEYGEDALAFWTHGHHLTSGNMGTVALLKFFGGLEVSKFKDRAFYEAQFERMRAGEKAFDDQRWREELGRRELYQFDRFCGGGNTSWGYEADRFSSAERAAFEAELRGLPVERGARLGVWLDSVAGLARRAGGRRLGLAAAAGAVWAVSIAATGLIVWAAMRGGR